MHHDTPLLNMLVSGFCLAFVLGALAQRIKLPPLVGYLCAGILVGPFTPGFVADQSIANELAEIGVILLMFGVGLHFSLKDLLAVKWIALPGALAQIIIATLLGMGLARHFGWSTGEGLVYGLALSVASTVVLLKALEERGLVASAEGKIAVGWLIVEDLAMVLTLVLLPALSGMLSGKAAGMANSADIGLTLLITLGKIAGFIAFMLIIGRRFIPWMLEKIVWSGSRELFRLAVLATALGMAWASAMTFGVSFALGAFFAGMVLAESEFSHRAAQESLPLRDAFSVLFFVSVGMLFNPHVLLDNPWAVLSSVAIVIVGKSIAALIIVLAFRHKLNTALTIAASLAQIGEFSFILASLGIQLNLLSAQAHALIIASAIISILLNPLIFSIVDRLKR